MPNNDKFQIFPKGFTLIELLITIALIGILSAIVVVSMNNPQKSARDAKRKSDLELIRSGLELYNSDCGSYPLTASFDPSTSVSLSGSGSCANTYIVTVPKDSMASQNYSYTSNGTTYVICGALEIAPSPAMDTSGCASCGVTCNYKVINP